MIRRILAGALLGALGFAVLVVFVTLLVEADLWLSGVLGLHKQIGTSSQTTENYASVSGHLPILVTIALGSGILVTAWRHWNCHEEACWRHGKYEVEGGIRFCDRHHPAKGHVGPATELHERHLRHLRKRRTGTA